MGDHSLSSHLQTDILDLLVLSHLQVNGFAPPSVKRAWSPKMDDKECGETTQFNHRLPPIGELKL